MARPAFVVVNGKNGLRGIIETHGSEADGTPHVTSQDDSGQQTRAPLADHQQVLMWMTNGQQILLPTTLLTLQSDGTYTLPYSMAELETQQGSGLYHDDDALVMPVIVEELDVQIRKVETGRVRIAKRVHERKQVIDEPLLREQVDIKRVAINQRVDGPIAARYEGDTLIVALLEEIMVVEKHLMLKEELHITRVQSEIRQPQQIILRSEVATVERLASQETMDSDPELEY